MTTSPGPSEPLAAPAPAPAGRVPYDTSFGVGGVIRDFTPGFTKRSAPTLPSSGGILLTGYAAPKESDFVVAKFISDGRPDPTFGTNGRTLLPPPGFASRDHIAVQPDGRILVATVLPRTMPDHRWFLARLRPDGALDTSFNGDGILQLSLPSSVGIPVLAGLLLREDGRILLVGSGNDPEFLAAQYLPNGQIDRSFGDDGKLRAELPGGAAQLAAAGLESSGNLVASGSTIRPDSSRDFLIARLRPNGMPDTSFGFNGTSIVDFGRGVDSGKAQKLLADGRILVAGMARDDSNGSSHPVLVRLQPDGDLDTTFGDGGLVRLDMNPGAYIVSAVELLSDGRIALAGYLHKSRDRHPSSPSAKSEPFVAVLRADGTPDRSFDGDDGVVFLGEGFSSGYVHMAAQAGDKLLVLAGTRAIRLLAAAPRVATLQMTIGASPNPAGPGPVHFHVTTTNNGASFDGGVLRLRASKKVALVSAAGQKASVAPNGIDVLSRVSAVPPGGTATLVLRTTVTGFEEGISLSGSLEATHPDGKPITSTSAITVTTSRHPTM